MKPITELCNYYDGQDVYVVGAGPTLDYIDKSFWLNKPVIGLNSVVRLIPVDWILTKDQWVVDELRADGQVDDNLIVSRHNFGNHDNPPITGGDYVFDHANLWDFEYSLTREMLQGQADTSKNQLAVGCNNFCTAMHLAAFMGAANIIMVANDGGSLDGKFYADGYRIDNEGASKRKSPYWNHDNALFRDWLSDAYGVNVYSLNPFLNIGLEGHIYQRMRDV
jgi:hypothetical protein